MSYADAVTFLAAIGQILIGPDRLGLWVVAVEMCEIDGREAPPNE